VVQRVTNLETYCRTLASSGSELLIVCGPSGFGTKRIPSGKAYIGSNAWKIIVSVPLGTGTAFRQRFRVDRSEPSSLPRSIKNPFFTFPV